MSKTKDKFIDVQPKYMASKAAGASPEKQTKILIIGRKDSTSPDKSLKTQVKYVNAKLKLSHSEAITPKMIELGMRKPSESSPTAAVTQDGKRARRKKGDRGS